MRVGCALAAASAPINSAIANSTPSARPSIGAKRAAEFAEKYAARSCTLRNYPIAASP
jgi:hypothetical protein